MIQSSTYVGMDTHKQQHTVAVLDGDGQTVEEFTVPNRPADIRRIVRRIARRAPGPVRYCYEAGVCGFALQRMIRAAGGECVVIAPSLIPRRPGQRIKTDRRDARKLAEMLRAGLLTEVRPPDEAQESVRELCRAREAALRDLNRTRYRLNSFLLRRALVYRQGSRWTQKHLQWLGGLALAQPCDREVLADALEELDRRGRRLADLTRSVEALAQSPGYARAVGWLGCFYGIKTVTAMTLVSELHGFERFDTARGLMGFVGMTPSEHSSGPRDRKGGITKAGNGRVRRVLIEAAWQQSRGGRVGPAVRRRRAGQPAWVVAIAEKARRRLHRRYWRLVSRGKAPAKAVTAVARELVGFVWSVLRWLPTDGPPVAGTKAEALASAGSSSSAWPGSDAKSGVSPDVSACESSRAGGQAFWSADVGAASAGREVGGDASAGVTQKKQQVVQKKPCSRRP